MHNGISKDGVPDRNGIWKINGIKYVVTGVPERWPEGDYVPLRLLHEDWASRVDLGWFKKHEACFLEIFDANALYLLKVDRMTPEYYEEQARLHEAAGALINARDYTSYAKRQRQLYKVHMIEEAAVEGRRYIAKAKFAAMTGGDRVLLEQKGLKEFAAYKGNASNFLYWV